MKQLTIAIDGPASSGKSTVAKQIARQLDLIYIDTGAMYRGVTYALLKSDRMHLLHDLNRLQEFMQQLELIFKTQGDTQELWLNGENISVAIRSSDVTSHVSQVAANPSVRHYLVEEQRQMAKEQSVIMDGRDIGSVVLPEATVKFYLQADPEVRAKRRYQENQSRNLSDETYEEVYQAIIERDYKDSHREVSPLVKAKDAITIDTSHLSIAQVVDKLLQLISQNDNNMRIQ